MAARAEPTQTPRILRVAPATVVIFSILFSPALLMAGVLVGRDRQVEDALLLCGIYAGALCWICSRSVELAPGRLVYRVMFLRREFDLSKAVAAAIVARPAPTLQLRSLGSREATPAFIVKPFSRNGVTAILQHIRDSNPAVELERLAQELNEGRFDALARESLRAMNLLRLVLLVVGMVVIGTLVLRFLR